MTHENPVTPGAYEADVERSGQDNMEPLGGGEAATIVGAGACVGAGAPQSQIVVGGPRLLIPAI